MGNGCLQGTREEHGGRMEFSPETMRIYYKEQFDMDNMIIDK